MDLDESVCFFYDHGVWNLYDTMNTPRLAPAAATPFPYPNEAHSLFVTVGYNGPFGHLNTGEVLTDAGWQEFLPYLPVTIVGHCMVLVNSTTVLVIGGLQNDEESPSLKTFYFNTENGNWIDGPNLLSNRYRHSCGKLQEESESSQYSVIVAGGYNGPFFSHENQTYCMSSVEILDFGASAWRKGPSLPFGISGASMVEDLFGGVVLIGGNNGECLDTLYQLSHANSEWILMPQKLKVARQWATAFFVRDEITNCK